MRSERDRSEFALHAWTELDDNRATTAADDPGESRAEGTLFELETIIHPVRPARKTKTSFPRPNSNALPFAVCLWFGFSTAVLALPCSLSEADYQALASTTEKSYAKSDIEALDPKDQEALCKARKFYREARGKDPRTFARTHTLNDIPARMSRFLTPEEYGQIRSAMNEVIVEDSLRKSSAPKGRK